MAQQEWWATEVLDYSSQYGKLGSTAFTVANIIGNFRIFPEHSDDPFNFSFLRYGKWWKISPQSCAFPQIKANSVSVYPCDEFIDLFFHTYICITKVEVFETYCPGAIHTIRVRYFHQPSSSSTCFNDMSFKWSTLWTRSDNVADDTTPPKKARIFSPPLKSVPTPPVFVIRLEFDCSASDYYNQVEAVRVTGIKDPNFPPTAPTPASLPRRSSTTSNHHVEDHVTMKPERPLALMDKPRPQNGYFEELPFEGILVKIFRYLSWSDLCRLAQVSQLLRNRVYAYQASLRELSFRHLWYRMDNSALIDLHNRLFNEQQLQRLDLSWCGPYHAITDGGFCEFLQCGGFGKRLVSLRLSNCSFITADSLFTVVSVCQHLKELDLSFCREVESDGFNALSRLLHLRWLSVCGTKVNDASLVSLVHTCHKLRHLNLAHCTHVRSLDDLLLEWSKTNHAQCVVSLDFWHGQISTTGGRLLAEHFPNLQDLNLGWCSPLKDEPQPDWLRMLVQSCRQLRRLILTRCTATLTDEVLRTVATTLGPNLEQLDILGAESVSENAVQFLLDNCPRLQLLDVSYVKQILQITVKDWTRRYPRCQIKKSHNHRR